MSTFTTRKHILDMALCLFNESGTAAISTNHIAAEAGISPGNLYYHYRNKEEIIRALVEGTLAEYEAAWQLPQGRLLRLEDLLTLVRASFEIQWRYRFLGRELVALIRHDPVLGQRYQRNYQQRIQQQKIFIQHLVDTDVLLPTLIGTELDEMLTACWVITDHWLPFLEATGQPVTYEQFQLGDQLILRIIRPYFAEP